MSDKVDIFMPIYIGDYLKDTNRLSTEEHGAYLLLMFDYWQHGALPDSDDVLARIARMSPDAWSNAQSTVLAFFKHSEGKWYHSRIDRELESARDKKAKAKARGKAGAKARWDRLSNGSSNASSNAQAMLEQCPSPSPSPSPLTSQSKSESSSYDGAYFEMVNEVINCRPEFANVNPSALAMSIHNAGSNPRLQTNHEEFIRNVVNEINPPNNPPRLYATYLQSDGGPKARGAVDAPRKGTL